MNEIRDEMKVMITQISDYQVGQAVAIVKAEVRQIEANNVIDKKRIAENFASELQAKADYFSDTVTAVRNQFEADIR